MMGPCHRLFLLDVGVEVVGKRVGARTQVEPGEAGDGRDAAIAAASCDEHDDVDGLGDELARHRDHRLLHKLLDAEECSGRTVGVDRGDPARSEEHTSELQSLMRTSYAVFCLKKKTPSYYKFYITL